MNKVKPDIVFLTESKLKEQLNSEVFDVDEYVIYRKDREIQEAPGGGVVLMIKSNLVSSDNNVSYLNNHAYREAAWCEIMLNNKKILIGVIYRPPSSTRELCNLIKVSGEYHNESLVDDMW